MFSTCEKTLSVIYCDRGNSLHSFLWMKLNSPSIQEDLHTVRVYSITNKSNLIPQ